MVDSQSDGTINRVRVLLAEHATYLWPGQGWNEESSGTPRGKTEVRKSTENPRKLPPFPCRISLP